ncbi:UDP-glycosyltransferase 83A1-like [Dioscorea cayenensis subsp. rotundata]|uniref:UDP-glycosyltransferase 83A1-like n=1 Tax=Dioscorea cayennensis subsp. rotundata TaxID=55577 RepID=A0AB40D6Q1_DIOCR|nr:UDP-glycosyltransferase 83A1-like [Dioscorea cayenensis subsp. rotundata]
MERPHALVLPLPLQGHVIPLLELSNRLVERGFKVTFVNTELNHARITSAMSNSSCDMNQIHFVTVPDGIEEGDDPSDLVRKREGLRRVLPASLEELIKKSNMVEDHKFTCFIVDVFMASTLDVAKKAGLHTVIFYPGGLGTLLIGSSIPKLIADGIIDEQGEVKTKGKFQINLEMPSMETADLPWQCFPDVKTKHHMFKFSLNVGTTINTEELILCNSFFGLENGKSILPPNILLIGPLLANQELKKPKGYLWEENTSCITWLDKQLPNSVIYIAFGSYTMFDHCQFEELALGLELSDKRFLWVVRPGLSRDEDVGFLARFRSRVEGRGMIVRWAPQQQVLAHCSIACFMSHCGWNSTLEGLANGVPFLCWPYFADQFISQGYICDIWKTGLRMNLDGNKVVSRKEIKRKVEELMGDEEMKIRAMQLKARADKSVNKGGHSFENFNCFVSRMNTSVH